MGTRIDAQVEGREGGISPGWGILAVIGLGGFAVLTMLLGAGATLPFDQPLLDAGRSLPVDVSTWRLLSDAANLPLIALGVGLIVGLLLTGRRREALVAIVVLVAVTAGSELVKQLVARPRPPGGDVVVPGVVYSYPSGHVLEALTIFGMIAILLWRTGRHRLLARVVGVFAVVFSLLVAVARVALDAHYPSDVLGGYLAAVGVLGIFALVVPFERPRAAPENALPSGERAAGGAS